MAVCVVAFIMQPNDGAKCAPCGCSSVIGMDRQTTIGWSADVPRPTDQRTGGPAKNST